MKRSILLGAGGALAFVALLAIVKFFQIWSAMSANQHAGPPPQAVTTHEVTEETWPVRLSAVGSLSPVQGALLRSETQGRVEKINVVSGERVTSGNVLVELDSAVERARLEGALARQELAQVNAVRQRKLRATNANSKADLDSAEAALQDAEAEVESLRAEIKRRQIVAPFSGVAGIRRVEVGQTIPAGTEVISLQALDDLFVNFSLPQRVLGQLELGSRVLVAADAFPDREFEAKLTAIDSSVDESTRNIRLQALLPNPSHQLRTGMFVDVTLVSPEADRVLTIPASGISYAPYGDSVYVLQEPQEKDSLPTVKSQTIKLGRRLGDRVAVVSGLSSGDTVVSSGAFKLHPGSQVIVNNTVQPLNELNPSPADT